MTEAFIQVPTDGSGKKVRTLSRTVGANTVHEQQITETELPTYMICTATNAGLADAQNKVFMAIFNGSSTALIKIREIWIMNTKLTAVTGVGVEWDIDTITSAPTGGNTITPFKMDSTNADLADITIQETPSGGAAKGVTIFPYFASNDEVITTQFGAVLGNILPVYPAIPKECQDITLRQNQGIQVKQITNSTVGSHYVIIIFTVE